MVVQSYVVVVVVVVVAVVVVCDSVLQMFQQIVFAVERFPTLVTC